MIQLNLESISDKATRDVLQSLIEELNKLPLQGDGEFLELSITGNPTNHKIPHRLMKKPKDVIVTSKIGPAEIEFHYDEFTRNLLVLTATGAAPTDVTTLRLFIGSFDEV